jgi:hypothetical protein
MSWLYVPGLQCSPKECALDASFLDSRTALSVTSKGKSLQPANLSRLWKQGSSIRRLSGLTCSPSTASRGTAEFIASLAASPASHGRRPASKKALPTKDGSGLTSHESFARLNRHFASLKTCGDLFQEADLSSSLLDLPISGSMRNGVLSPRPMLTLVTSGNESSSWPTARANDSEKRGEIADDPRNGLVSAALHWMTPCVPNGGRALAEEFVIAKGKTPTGKRTVGLEAQVKFWSTPAARDWKGGGQAVTRKDGKSRLDMLDWQAEAFSRPVLSAIDGRELSPTARILRRRLNPMFVCWLMGWPMWWTNPAVTNSVKPAMASYRSLLQSHLSYLLGEPDLQVKEAA